MDKTKIRKKRINKKRKWEKINRKWNKGNGKKEIEKRKLKKEIKKGNGTKWKRGKGNGRNGNEKPK